MPFRVLATMIERALRESDHDVVEFIWHGGEPTILPISFYEKAVLIQARFRRLGQTIRNSLQTNGTRITPEWARFLRDYKFHVGVSIDGPRQIHDLHRRGVAGHLLTPRPKLEEFIGYLDNNQNFIVNYGDRYRHGEPITSSFVESAVNQVVSKRFVRQQQMTWRPAHAHDLLQVRTAVLNEQLRSCFMTIQIIATRFVAIVPGPSFRLGDRYVLCPRVSLSAPPLSGQSLADRPSWLPK
jgi:hypothetical protein